MITVEEAFNILKNNIVPLPNFQFMDVSNTVGCVLFEDVYSPIDMPPFRQSAMDGYALCLNGTKLYTIIGEVKAGDDRNPTLKQGEAVRIFTGAPVPDSANAVIMQEKVTVNGQDLSLENLVPPETNIRAIGEQIKSGSKALSKGTFLTPAAIGFLTSLGHTKIKVFKYPKIAIITTGNELIEAGRTLNFGQIYESNAVMLTSSLNGIGYPSVTSFKVEDDYKSTFDLLGDVIDGHDVVLVSGGISVGDYDYVGKALQNLNVIELFYKVKQKPGKPLFFGKKGDKVVFALPGNPAAALSCFYIYVLPALKIMSGNLNFALTRIKAKSTSLVKTKGDRAQFLKAIYNNGTVEILEGQSSSMLHTFALANALVYINETTDEIKINDLVEVIILPIN